MKMTGCNRPLADGWTEWTRSENPASWPPEQEGEILHSISLQPNLQSGFARTRSLHKRVYESLWCIVIRILENGDVIETLCQPKRHRQVVICHFGDVKHAVRHLHEAQRFIVENLSVSHGLRGTFALKGAITDAVPMLANDNSIRRGRPLTQNPLDRI